MPLNSFSKAFAVVCVLFAFCKQILKLRIFENVVERVGHWKVLSLINIHTISI